MSIETVIIGAIVIGVGTVGILSLGLSGSNLIGSGIEKLEDLNIFGNKEEENEAFTYE